MIETEAKIKLNEKEFKRFVNLFNRPYFFNQENIIYETPEGFVRIRREKEKKIIALKKSAEGEFNSRTEIEFETKSDLATLKEFFKNLNIAETLTYRKRRANIYWGGCTISLDIIRANDYYIEIEGEPSEIKKTIQKLNLQDHELETRPYLEILKSPKPSPSFQPE